MPDDAVTAAERTGEARFGRAKDGHDRNADQGREMHGAGVVGEQ